MKGEASPSVTLRCPGCGRSSRLPLSGLPAEFACPGCRQAFPLAGSRERPGASLPEICPVCRSPYLYSQKDLGQAWGCLFVAAGAALVPWTYGLSLAVVALLDLLLYKLLPRISVCYVCKSRFRGLPPHAAHEAYDLAVAQTYEARMENWASGKLRPAFTESEAASAERPARH